MEKHEGNVLYLRTSRENYKNCGRFLKNLGFRLLTVSAVDWLKKGLFDVYFLAHDIDGNIYVRVVAEIPREKPRIASLSDLWKNAAMHERETWELFGIVFDGNKMLKPLFLEDWKGPPPFRKDFDVRKATPYETYEELDFKVPRFVEGDAYHRALCRRMEIEESLNLVEQALEKLPSGKIREMSMGNGRKFGPITPIPAGEGLHRVESARGELCFHAVSDGSAKPYRVKVKGSTFDSILVLCRRFS